MDARWSPGNPRRPGHPKPLQNVINPMIDIRGLAFAYPGTTFRLAIDMLAVAPGERVAVVGPSGSGKTTLLNLLAGIAQPNGGVVRVDGVEVGALDDHARRDFRLTRIGFVFQDFELLDYLDVFDNVLHPYRIGRALRLDDLVRERAAGLLARMGLGDKRKRHPDQLSQGERQRVAICRALLPGPKLLLADEATGNLDPENKTRILDLLFENAAEHDATLLAVTHDHELLPRFDRVIDFRDFHDGTGA
jgi:ABC-type lipoprotein export system ATPase subunit